MVDNFVISGIRNEEEKAYFHSTSHSLSHFLTHTKIPFLSHTTQYTFSHTHRQTHNTHTHILSHTHRQTHSTHTHTHTQIQTTFPLSLSFIHTHTNTLSHIQYLSHTHAHTTHTFIHCDVVRKYVNICHATAVCKNLHIFVYNLHICCADDIRRVSKFCWVVESCKVPKIECSLLSMLAVSSANIGLSQTRLVSHPYTIFS